MAARAQRPRRARAPTRSSPTEYALSRFRLHYPDERRDEGLEAAIRDSVPTDRVTVHAKTCPMGEGCDCIPLTLAFGARA